MMTGMVRSGCCEQSTACDQGLPDDIFFELTIRIAEPTQIPPCQTRRLVRQFCLFWDLFFFEGTAGRIQLWSSTGLKCTDLKIACRRARVANGLDDFIWKLSHRSAFITSWTTGHLPGRADTFHSCQLRRSTSRWHSNHCKATFFFFFKGRKNLLNTECELMYLWCF